MRPISFGKLPVQNAGVPVRLGYTFLTSAATTADPTVTVNSATPFCADMVPFKMYIDPGQTTEEKVMVTNISGKTFNVSRGIDGTTPQAHGTSAVCSAIFPFTSAMYALPIGATGKAYIGTKNLNKSTLAGCIDQLSTASVSDRSSILPSDHEGNPLWLTDYAVDDDVNGEGPLLTLFTR